jgi:hypothetical protein
MLFDLTINMTNTCLLLADEIGRGVNILHLLNLFEKTVFADLYGQ